jgi:hypothetical protein
MISTGVEDNEPALFYTDIANYESQRISRLLCFGSASLAELAELAEV